MSSRLPRTNSIGSAGLWVLLGGVGLGVITLGAMGGYWLVQHLVAGFTLTQQPLSVTLPPFDLTAGVERPLTIQMQGKINADVPLKQTLNLPLRGKYRAEVRLDSPVHLKTIISYDGTLPVDTEATITARANLNFQDVKSYRNLEFTAKLPMKMVLPVKLTAPVDQVVQVKYTGQLDMNLNQTISAPVDITIPATLNVDQTITTPVKGRVTMTATPPTHPVRGYIKHADLRLHINRLRFEKANDPDKPLRTRSIWGEPDTADH